MSHEPSSQPLQIAYKSIRLRDQVEPRSEEIGREFGLSPLTARILAARGFEPSVELKNFLEPSLREGLPHPAALKGLKEACEVVREVAESGGTIAIACDFDVDGLSGGSLLYSFLRECKIRSRVFVPDRFEEGYGLNERIVREAKANGHSLLVTVDYGTTSTKELSLARELGLKTIVIDHHHVQEAPVCDVFINPKQEGCGFAGETLCAVGLVWYFTLGLKRVLSGIDSVDPKTFLDLACLGTICDMVPLNGPNRVIAKRGLELLAQSTRPGLVALRNVIGAHSKLSCSHVSFGIGPRLNAAGRLVSGELVVELLTTEDSKKAEKIAKRLDKLNKERQTIEEQVKEGAVQKLEERGELPSGIVVWDREFHTGVIGIV
ncbi:MAG: hypothetical protein KDD64_13635, partial [Bdellovibrionales bacterium]|nr:hypothetical protein [Bdellovibrionales bacterium]